MVGEPINLLPEFEEQVEPISLVEAEGNRVPSPQVAEQRANKATYVLRNNDPDVEPEALTSQILAGDEEGLRRKIALSEALDDEAARRQAMTAVVEEVSSRGEQLGQEDLEILQSLNSEQLLDTKNALEKAYARRASLDTVSSITRDSLDKSLEEDPQFTDEVQEVFERQLFLNEGYNTYLQELQQRSEDVGLGKKTSDFIETLVPFLSQARLTDIGDGILGGNALQVVVDRIRDLPPDEQLAEVRRIGDDLFEGNTLDAFTFVKAVQAFSAHDKGFENLWTFLDVADVATLGFVTKGSKALLKATSSLSKLPVGPQGKRFANTVRDAARAFRDPNVQPSDVIAASGDVDKAVKSRIIEGNITRITTPEEALPHKLEGRFNKLSWELPSLYNTDYWMNLPGRIARAKAARVSNFFSSSRSFNNDIAKTLREAAEINPAVVRNTPEALSKAFDEAATILKERHPHLPNAMLDVIEVAPEATKGNVGRVLFDMGRINGTLFDSQAEARLFATSLYKLRDGFFEVVAQGDKHFIRLSKDIDETTSAVRSTPISTEAQTPRNALNAFLGFFRNPDDLVSFFERGNRNIATHLTQEVRGIVSTAFEALGPQNLNKKQVKDLTRILHANRVYTDPLNGRVGQFHKDLPQLENEYMRLLNRLPSEAEANAYFAYVQISDFDYMFRNLEIFRDKSRQGIEELTFNARIPGAEEGETVFSSVDFVEGRQVKTLDTSNNPAFLIIDDVGKDNIFRTWDEMTPQQKSQVVETVEGNTPVFMAAQIANPREFPLKRLTGGENREVILCFS